MARPKLDTEIVGMVSAYLDLDYSERRTIYELYKKKIFISKGFSNKIKKIPLAQEKIKKNNNRKYRELRKLTTEKLKKLKEMALCPNPPTQRYMAKVLRCSQPNINKLIHRRLNLKKIKKLTVHRLTPYNINKLKKRAFKLYMKLNKVKWQNYITTDDAWFYISDINGITKIQYISRSQKNAEIGVYENR